MIKRRGKDFPKEADGQGLLRSMNRFDRVGSGQGKTRGEEERGDGATRGTVSIELNQAVEKRTGRLVEWIPSPHFDERIGMIDAVVLHYTATGSLEETIDLFQREGKRASAHYVIGKDGRLIQMVDVEKKAWHAGQSEFQGRSDVNDFSIGIELVNWGLLKERDGVFFAWPGDYGTEYRGQSPVYAGGEWWDSFTGMQYRVLTELIREIRVRYPSVTSDRIVGHQSIALPRGRKIDPGLAFDLERVIRA